MWPMGLLFKMSNVLAHLCNRIFYSTSIVVFDMVNTDTCHQHLCEAKDLANYGCSRPFSPQNLCYICGYEDRMMPVSKSVLSFSNFCKTCVGFNNMTLSSGGEVIIKDILLGKRHWHLKNYVYCFLSSDFSML